MRAQTNSAGTCPSAGIMAGALIDRKRGLSRLDASKANARPGSTSLRKLELVSGVSRWAQEGTSGVGRLRAF